VTGAITDFSQFGELRSAARDHPDDPQLLRQVAGQFEALFVQTLLENMRNTSLGDPIFGTSSSHDMYLDMLDKQLAVEMTRKQGFGLADVLVRQLGGGETARTGAAPGAFDLPPRMAMAIVRPPAPMAEAPTGVAPEASQATETSPSEDRHAGWRSAESFVRDIWPHARRAARRLGVDTRAVIAQAALETGWGAGVPQRDDGSTSFNLFGIKAGPDWSGDSVRRATVEFSGGIARREAARFRAYDDLGSAFDDYVGFIREQPRYKAALGTRGDPSAFGAALQEAGYATDPEYADKIRRVLASDTLQNALATLKTGAAVPMTSMAADHAAP